MSTLIFTADFHQLTRGNFDTDLVCLLQYDPQRFWVQYQEYIFGQQEVAIKACGIFHPLNKAFEIVLHSKIGMLRETVVELDGTGSMLSAELGLPPDTTELEIWFTLTTPDGKVYYDSNQGKNYKFRFVRKDIIAKEISVVNDSNQTHARIIADFTTPTFVDSVNLRYRVTNSGNRFEEKTIPLIPNKDSGTGEVKWKADQELVPHNAVVAYDFSYFINGVKFKDDNDGKYFLLQATGNT